MTYKKRGMLKGIKGVKGVKGIKGIKGIKGVKGVKENKKTRRQENKKTRNPITFTITFTITFHVPPSTFLLPRSTFHLLLFIKLKFVLFIVSLGEGNGAFPALVSP